MNERDNYRHRLPNGISEESYKRLAKFADRLPGGNADDMDTNEFDQYELNKGIQEELEHTNNPEVAEEIAMDHLVGDPEYYTDDYEKEGFLHVGSMQDVPSEFEYMGKGFYRKGHSIWELKQDDGDLPFKLIRKREERSIDTLMRTAMSKTAQTDEVADMWDNMSADDRADLLHDNGFDNDMISHLMHSSWNELEELVDPNAVEDVADSVEGFHGHEAKVSCIKVGQKVSTIYNGKLAEATVVVVNNDDTSDIKHDDGAMECGVPNDMLSVPMEPMMVMLEVEEEPGSAFKPEISEETEDRE